MSIQCEARLWGVGVGGCLYELDCGMCVWCCMLYMCAEVCKIWALTCLMCVTHS